MPQASSLADRPFDAFISYSSKDKEVADALVHRLEQAEVRCWIAPRDILPGANWSESIIGGINECKVLVLILTADSNTSQQVLQEVERAVHKGLTVLPFRVADVPISPSLELFIGARHWLDAMTRPMDQSLGELAEAVLRVLGRKSGAAPAPAPAPVAVTEEARASSWMPKLLVGGVLLAAGALALLRPWEEEDGPIHGGEIGQHARTITGGEKGNGAEETVTGGRDTIDPKPTPPPPDPVAPAPDPAELERERKAAEAKAAEERAARFEAEHEQLQAAIVAGRILSTSWEGGRYSLQIHEREADGTQVRATLLRHGDDAFCSLFEGELRLTEGRQIGSGSARTALDGWNLNLRPAKRANPDLGRSQDPTRGAGLVLLPQDQGEGLLGVAGDRQLRFTIGEAAETSAPDWAGLLAAGSVWEGHAQVPGQPSAKMRMTVTAFDPESGAVRLLAHPVGQPEHPAAAIGTVDLDPAAARGWAMTAHKEPQKRPTAIGHWLGNYRWGLNFRIDDQGRLIGLVAEERLVLKRKEQLDWQPDRAAAVAQAVAAGTRWRGRSHPVANGPVHDIVVDFVETDPDAGVVQAVAYPPGNPRIVTVLSGSLSREDTGVDEWPLQLGKEANSISGDQRHGLFANHRADVQLRLTDDGELVGWCGDDRLELEPVPEPEDPARSGQDYRDFVLGACRAGKTWEVYIQPEGRAAFPAKISFKERSRDGSQVKAILSATANVKATFEGSIELDSSRAHDWPIRLLRTTNPRTSLDSSGLFHRNKPRQPLYLRIAPDGTIWGICGTEKISPKD